VTHGHSSRLAVPAIEFSLGPLVLLEAPGAFHEVGGGGI